MALTNQNNPQFRGLPPLRGGSGTSSYKGGQGNIPQPPKVKTRNYLTAGVLFLFVGAIYFTALNKMSQVLISSFSLLFI